MELVIFLAIFGVGFVSVIAVLLWVIWRKYRMVTIAIPAGGDLQAFHFKLSETIRSVGFRPDGGSDATSIFRAPGWQKWATGLQDISVAPAIGGVVQVTGPALGVGRVGRIFAGAATQSYTGPQPFGPLAKGMLRMFLVLIGLLALAFTAAYLSGA